MSDQGKRIRLTAHRIAPLPAALALLTSGGAMAQAMPDNFATRANIPLTDNVLTNDVGTGLVVQNNSQPSHGGANVASDGSFTYFPDNGFSGVDSFVYTARDSADNPSNAVVSITVTPVIVYDHYTTPAGVTLTGNVLTNDLGVGLTATETVAPNHGTLTLAPNGAFTYVPDPGFSGHDTASYIIDDSAGSEDFTNAAFQVTVTAAAAISTSPVPATTPVALGVLATLLAGLGLRRRRKS
jgi:large repetitive protein